jgi:hypothetical protein
MFRPRGLHWQTLFHLLVGRKPTFRGMHRVFLSIVDHFEPMWGRAGMSLQRERVDRWVREYPRLCCGIEDSRSRPPQHTFFYPAEEYEPEHLEKLAGLCRQGLGDVEIHLHHDNDTADNLRNTLETFKHRLHEGHGLLKAGRDGQVTYGFVHGNWALDNSRPDGRWCGVNNELTVLRETGCYADFTMPSAPSSTQTRSFNSIYYAIDDPDRPKSHDRGIPAQVGAAPPARGLLMIQGPIALDWGRRKFGLLPRLENGDLTDHFPPTLARLERWLWAAVSVAGREDWCFVKLHTHGAQEKNAAMLLGEPMREFHESLADFARQSPELTYYYVTAREMADLVHQAEQGALEPELDRAQV